MGLTRITSDGITDAAIVNADINASAAIAGTKITPSFTGNVSITNTQPKIFLTDSDTNSDFSIRNMNGVFGIHDQTNSQDRFTIDSNGTINTSGTLNSTGKLVITQSTSTIPEIELNGSGPNFIRFTDSSNAAHSLDLVFRDSPNTLGIEKSSDGTSLFTVDCDDGLVTVANDLKVDGDIRLLSDASNPVLKITGSGPNFITFASDSSGTVDADSINLVYRTSPNTLGFERASDATILFTVDADNGQANFPFNLDVGAGLDVTGNITVSGTVDGVDIAALSTTVSNITTDVVSDTSPQLGGSLDTNNKNINFGDSTGNGVNRQRMGASNDLQLYHNGSNSFITNNTGQLEIRSDTLLLQDNTNGHTMVKGVADGAVELYYDNSQKFQTLSDGVKFNGILHWDVNNSGRAIELLDNQKIFLGDGTDLQIFHDGNQSIIRDTGTGSLMLQGSQVIMESADGGEVLAKFIDDGAVELYHNNVKRITTRSGGNAQDGAVIYGNSSNVAVNFFTDTTVRGSVYANSSNQIGFLDETGNWSVNFDRGATSYIFSHFVPDPNNTYDLGSTSNRWRNIYTNDLNLSNEGSSNDVDGTWGSYTIQEGAEDLFLVNKRNGKKYKFNLTEVL